MFAPFFALLFVQLAHSWELGLSRTVCFHEFELGCFTNAPPWRDLPRPISLLPDSPAKIATDFSLFTRQNRNEPRMLLARANGSLTASTFSPQRHTKILVHGFLDYSTKPWLLELKNELLTYDDYNVIIVGWGAGSGFPYTQATANARVVGAEIALLLKKIKVLFNYDPAKVHVIGHSLGAHVAGYVGYAFDGMGRITGLDPAEPLFQYTEPIVRLDPTDANFVDVIHTDANSMLEAILIKGGLGMYQAVGHLDFYPNGGMYQPRCNKSLVTSVIDIGAVEGAKLWFGCDHLRAIYYFNESVNAPKALMAHECSSYEEFSAGTCLDCTKHLCSRMGLHADVSQVSRTGVAMYVKTAGNSPYLVPQLKVELEVQQDSNSVRGDLWLRFFVGGIAVQGGTLMQVFAESQEYKPGYKHWGVVSSGTPQLQRLDDITAVEVYWQCRTSSVAKPWQCSNVIFGKKFLRLAALTLFSYDLPAANSIKFCGGEALNDKDTKRFNRC